MLPHHYFQAMAGIHTSSLLLAAMQDAQHGEYWNSDPLSLSACTDNSRVTGCLHSYACSWITLIHPFDVNGTYAVRPQRMRNIDAVCCYRWGSNFSSRAFSVSAPSTWNSLPAHIRSIDTLSTFKRHLG